VVDKKVVPPNGDPVDPLPPQYLVTVTCGGQETNLTFGAAGGGAPQITGLASGTVCTVVEQTAGFPAEAVVTYDPPGANTTGVTIPAGNVGVTVSIINDFTRLPVQTAAVRVVKELVQPVPPGVQLPSEYTVHLECSDGTNVVVTLPGAGGAGTPATVPVAVRSLCGLQEDSTALPPGWTVTYRVDGGAPTTDLAVFTVESAAEITVTVVNDPTGAATTTTTSTVPVSTPSTTAAAATTAPATAASTSTTAAAGAGGSAGGGASGAGSPLPTTGSSTPRMGFVAASILLFGIALLLLSRRDDDMPPEAESSGR
jgi:hypothetical protein